jgi:molybdenum cofactor synthesis domain-containing protein
MVEPMSKPSRVAAWTRLLRLFLCKKDKDKTMRGASAVVIGNEILTAKVIDLNTPHLLQCLRKKGIPVVAVHTVCDDVDAIVESIVALRHKSDWLFTSGGVGPTHDDVTVAAVALALGKPLVELAEMRALIEKGYAGRAVPQAAFRMAQAPEGSRLLYPPSRHFPVLACDTVFMLPGVPRYFQLQLDTVLQTLPNGSVFVGLIYVSAPEPELAPVLDELAQRFADVAFGSYPVFDSDLDYAVKITVECGTQSRTRQAFDALRDALPAQVVVRAEAP